MQNKYDVVIIGAGAAGLMCAHTAAARNKKVALLDHSNKLAEKIRISGGGRCNFTNINTSPSQYISNNPAFCISPLSRYTPNHFCELLDKYNITYHEKTLGQLFCDGKSEQIIDLLDFLCKQNNVVRKMGVKVEQIEQNSSGFCLITDTEIIQTEVLVIASGGLSIPYIGASGFGYAIAKQFKLNIVPTKPALVPLTLGVEQLESFANLSGTSFFSRTSIGRTSFTENSLITHRGLSGPAILQISSYWDKDMAITLDLLPTDDICYLLEMNRKSNKLLNNFLHQFFSEKFALSLCDLIGINKSISQLSNKEIAKIKQTIHGLTITPNGTLGYKKAEVTKGGVDTRELSSKTMAVKNNSNLFFIGEVVDVTGHLGGYNFQWAWASAVVCGNSI
ncbi:MAG: NAD(P)/FAD-dependent oxidoreductase [Burkholderiales bacterium]|nr:NAD(P)/FAD-dependent oxidoreductase [Burkholderiales bacterium]